jgi:hypothetical protein
MTQVAGMVGEAGSTEVHEAIAATLAELDRVDVRWCLLRGADELHLVDGDVDLLVSRSDVARLRRALAALGGPFPRPSWGRQPHVFFVGPAGRHRTPIKIDVVTELCFGGHGELVTGTADRVLAGRRREGQLWLPAPADAFWALLLHVLLDRGRIRAERAAELQTLAPGAREQHSALRDVVAAACPPSWDPERVLDAVERGAWEELQSPALDLREGWPGSTPMSRARTVALRRNLRRADRLRRKAQQRGSIASKRRARSTG